MSHPYERPPVPIANLTAEDHVLLAHIADEQFALRHVVGNSIHLHPAQQTLLTLTQWLKLPHIAAAARELQADLREYESVRLEFLQRHSIDGLVDAMHSASRNLKLLEESRTHNIQHTRAVEELRLAAQALNRATRPNQPACTPKPRHSASHHAVVKANSRGSSAKPTPPEDSPSNPTRSHDAQTCDDIPPSATAPLCHSVTSSSDSTPRHLDTSTHSSSSPPSPLRGDNTSTSTTHGGTATRLPPPIHHQPDGLKDSSSLHAAASAALPDA